MSQQNLKSQSDENVKNLSKVIKVNEDEIKSHLSKVVKDTVEDTLNKMLDEEANRLCNAGRYASHFNGFICINGITKLSVYLCHKCIRFTILGIK